MISSAICCEKNKSKFFKDNKIARALKASTINSLEKKLTSAYLHQITSEIRLSLVNNLHEKSITEVLDRM